MLDTLFFDLVPLIGLVIFVWRFLPLFRTEAALHSGDDLVSIIVPCRNEASNIEACIQSLLRLDYHKVEIIIVDDESTDATNLLASRFPVTVIRAPERPAGYCGKNWACSYGATKSQGKYLLFTDADTEHFSDSLSRAISYLKHHNADLLSGPPFHRAKCWWEKGLGFFYLIPLIATNYARRPQLSGLYAIGQYLLFNAESYRRMGGHKAVFAEVAEDHALARLTIEQGLTYRVFPQANPYSVQMYPNFGTFTAGWLRLIRLGAGKTNSLSYLALYCTFSTVISLFQPERLYISIPFVGLLISVQAKHGKFNPIGALLAPLSLVIFTLLSGTALGLSVLRVPIVWRGRSYARNFQISNASSESNSEARTSS